ncbi:MAG: DUF4234 domain-containing protein [Clostridiales bacterium]|nr:DUF4234 domain-containing protein [Clostridiales bacterium]
MRRIQTDRNIVMYVLLNIITCGIYGYYFIYKLAEDVNIMCKDDGQSTAGLGMFILLSFITCGFYAYYWYYQIGNRLQANAPKYGISIPESGTTILLWCVVGMIVCGLGQYVAMHLIIKNTNAMATAYNMANGL